MSEPSPRARAREQTMRDIVRIGRAHLATEGAAALSLRENPALLTLSPFEASTPAKIAAAAAASIRGGFVAGPISPDRGPFL